MDGAFLPQLDLAAMRAAYAAAPGHELDRLESPESSAALAANAFGLFLAPRCDALQLPQSNGLGLPASAVALEATLRFPWSGGRHPYLDVLVTTPTALIGLESKRFEPFRAHKADDDVQEAYSRDVWGSAMEGYQRIREGVATAGWQHLDAKQLFKHALALRTAVQKEPHKGLRPVLFYVYAEPTHFPQGKAIDDLSRARHRAEIARFAETVRGDEVEFRACSYRELLACWAAHSSRAVRAHAAAVQAFFDGNL